MNIIYKTLYSRQEALQNPTDMYIFTDTLKRSSGHGGTIDPESWYFREYQPKTGLLALWYPETTTTSVVRGLLNAYPVCTAKGMWTKEESWNGGLWEDTDFQEFRDTLEPEFIRILQDLSKYHRLILPWPGLTGRHGSKITKERCPWCWSWLEVMTDKILRAAKDLP